MAVAKLNRTRLDRIEANARLGGLALLECNDKTTGEPVDVLCVARRTEDGGAVFTPVAILPRGDIEDLVVPPESGEESEGANG